MAARQGAKIIGALVVVAALAAVGSSFAGAQSDDTRRGTDPLSGDEQSAAVDEAGAASGGGTESAGANGLPERLVLLVERHEEAKDADPAMRRADVYEYSYRDDTLTTSVVDLESGRVDETTSSQGTQLPLVEVESARARDLLFADQEFIGRLEVEFEAATGRPLDDPSADLLVQPIVFRADSMPVVARGGAAECGVKRCAQFLIQSTDHLLINLFPLVDLSDGVVLTADGVAQ